FLQELQSIYDFGWRSNVFIVDDNFISNKAKTKELLKELIPWMKERKYPFKFIIQASINLAEDDELLYLMKEANFIKAFVGLESPSNESLKYCGKMQNVGKDIPAAVKKIHSYGIQVMAGFIVGFDTDTEEIFTLQEKFIQKIKVVKAMIGPLVAAPLTPLTAKLERENRLTGDTTGVNDDTGINFIPKMGLENLLSGYKRLKRNVYRRKYYYRRIHAFLKDYKYSARGGNNLSWEKFMAFLKTILYIGIFSGDSPYYWRLVIYTVFRKTKSFSTVLEMAVERRYLAKS
ncbi:MAG: DUF4070 domain-containing protein, partial [Patescibacteria group bacterium]